MYERQMPMGDVIGVSPLTSLIGSFATIFQGKPSDFRVWMYFDNNGRYTRQLGDKPNSTTVGMANAVIQAWSQYIAQLNASGAGYNLPSDFVVNIGQRDPSYIYMPSSPHGDPFHGGGTNAKSQLAGPGDPNGVIQGMVNFLKPYMTGNTAAVAQASGSTVLPGGSAGATIGPGQPVQGSVVANPAGGYVPGFNPGITSPLAYQQPMAFPTYEPAQPISSPGYVPAQQGSMFGSLYGSMPTMLTIGGIGILAIAMMNSSDSAPRTRTVYRTRRPRRASRR